jgi:hypothetical protein
MLAIVNVTADHTQTMDDYEIRVNALVIGRFKHKRAHSGAAQCLRDAADALDARAADALDARAVYIADAKKGAAQ